MPLKREAVALAVGRLAGRRASPERRTRSCSSTVRLHADNTDVPGAVAALRARYDGPVTGATILGGGATAASTALALCELGARSITLLVRSPARAAETLAAIDRHATRPAVTVGSLADDPVVGDVVVSTLPHEAQTADLVDRCAPVPVVFEVVYDPWPTPLAASAGDRVLVTGLDLLLHQAALQFEMFTGLGAPVEAMRAAGEAASRRAGRAVTGIASWPSHRLLSRGTR